MTPRTPVLQPQPTQAEVVPKPDRGPINAATGISETLIKTGENYSGDLAPGPYVLSEKSEKNEG